MKIIYQGVEGSFSALAAHTLFPTTASNGSIVSIEGTPLFRSVFEAIEHRRCDYGVIPLENSLAGSVQENIDYLSRYKIAIVRELYERIEHQLLGLPLNNPEGGELPSSRGDARVQALTTICSHPMALAQCEGIFTRSPWITREARGDTAGCALFVAQKGDPTIAAIASREAGKRYGLIEILSNVEDNPLNFTRFVVIRNEHTLSDDQLPEFASRKEHKLSVLFTLPHRVGSLAYTLTKISEVGGNLSKIESRPIPGKPFEYFFYADIEGAHTTLMLTLDTLKTIVPYVKLLGCYRAGIIPGERR